MADSPDGHAILAYGSPSMPASVGPLASRDFAQFPLRGLAGECRYWKMGGDWWLAMRGEFETMPFSELSSTTHLRSLLKARGISYDSVSNEVTYVYLPDRAIGYFGAADSRNQGVHARVMPLSNDGCRVLRTMAAEHSTWLSPEQAVNATIDMRMPDDDPRNFVPSSDDDAMSSLMGSMSKVPGLPIGADPDWVDWVAGLRHDEPRSLRDAVEQIVYDAICFGGDMGPNGNTWYGTDEGMVYTEQTIDGWVRLVEEAMMAEPSNSATDGKTGLSDPDGLCS